MRVQGSILHRLPAVRIRLHLHHGPLLPLRPRLRRYLAPILRLCLRSHAHAHGFFNSGSGVVQATAEATLSTVTLG